MRHRRLLAGAAATAAVLATAPDQPRRHHDRRSTTPLGPAGHRRQTVLVLPRPAPPAEAVQAVEAAGGRVLAATTPSACSPSRPRPTGFASTVSESDAAVPAPRRRRPIGHAPDAQVGGRDEVENEHRGRRPTGGTSRGQPLGRDRRRHGPARRPSCGACGWCASDQARTVQAGDAGVRSASSTPVSTPATPTWRARSTSACPATSSPTSPDDRRTVRVRRLHRPGQLGRLGPRHARRRHGRRSRQRLRRLRRRTRTSPWSNIRGGQDSGFLFLEPVVERPDLRRRHRPRRHQHVVLRRPVAVQLHARTRPTRRRRRPSSARSSRR